MAIQGSSPSVFGKLNANAMLNSMVRNGIGILAYDGVPTAASFANQAGPGMIVVDINTGAMYYNTGTKAVPVWSSFGSAVAGLAGLGAASVAKMTYNFAVDGGAIATITPVDSPTIPANAIILGGALDITTTLTSGGAATIALGLGAGAQVAALKTATAVATYAAGTTVPIIPVFTAATYLKVAAATRLTLTVAAFALTAGRMDLNVVYVMGNA